MFYVELFMVTLLEENGYTFMVGNCQNCLASLLKVVHSKMKEFAPLGSKFFHFRVDLFSQGTWHAVKLTGDKSYLPCKKW